MIVCLKRGLIALTLIGLLARPSVTRATVNQPIEIINRPRTLPGGELELHGGVDLAHSSYTDMTGTHGQSTMSTPLSLGYGVNNVFDVYAFYSIGLHPKVTGKQPIDVRLAYTFFRDSRSSAAAQVESGVDFGNKHVTPLRLGVNALYRVTTTLAIFTPGEQLSVGLSDGHEIGLDLLIGGGLQLTPQVFGSLTTNLAHIAIANEGGSSFILADMLPANLAAFYSFSSGLDVGAHLDIDLKHTNDIVVGVLVRAFL